MPSTNTWATSNTQCIKKERKGGVKGRRGDTYEVSDFCSARDIFLFWTPLCFYCLHTLGIYHYRRLCVLGPCRGLSQQILSSIFKQDSWSFQFHIISKELRLQRSSGDCPNPCSEEESPRAGCVQLGFEYLQGWRPTTSSHLTTLMGKRLFHCV